MPIRADVHAATGCVPVVPAEPACTDGVPGMPGGYVHMGAWWVHVHVHGCISGHVSGRVLLRRAVGP